MKHLTRPTAFFLVAAVVAATGLIPLACTENAGSKSGAQANTGSAQPEGFQVLPGDNGFGADRFRTPPPPRPTPLPLFFDPKQPLQARVHDLVSRLTLEEKVSLMQMASAEIPRLGITRYDWWSEALHGVANTGTATVFPEPIGMAAAWDVDLHFQVARVIGIEGRAKHAGFVAVNDFGRFKGLDFWSPNVNIFRDPRWGRGQETYGEDPYLSGRLGIQFVNGLQGDDPFYLLTVATPKHYAVHSGPEALRHRFDAVITDQDLYTTYLPQFEATVREGHAYSIMSAYSALNGVPDPGNRRLLTDILRTQWGFDGCVVSDVDSVSDIYRPNSHGYVAGAVEASALAVKAGNDLDSGTTYGEGRGGPSHLATAVQEGLITEPEVDVAVGRLMAARIRLGEFDPPGYKENPYNKITPAMNDTPEHHELAHKMADESMVLLKNANHTLPFTTSIGTVAVLGPNANVINMQYGNYNGTPSQQHRISILDGIRNAIGADHVLTTTSPRMPLVSERIALAEMVQAGSLYTDASRSRHGLTVAYAADVEGLAQPAGTDISETGAFAAPPGAAATAATPLAARMTGVLVPPRTGDYQLGARAHDGFRITLDGKVVLDSLQGRTLRTAGTPIHLDKDRAYNLTVDYVRGGAGRGRGAFGQGGFGRGGFGRGRGPAGPAFGATESAPGITAAPAPDSATDPLFQLAWTRPTEDGAPADTTGHNLYAESVDLAAKADAVVLVVGIDGSQEGEMRDRDAIELPTIQENLIRQVVKAAGHKPVVVVNCSGSPMALTWEDDNVPAIVQAWYPGQRGDAIADVLFGKYNPGGKLPVTFYRATADLPPFTDYAMHNRTYRYSTGPVLYPFGHGLSYTTFAYSALKAPPKSGTGDEVRVSVTVQNTGTVDGDEIVQCYLNRDLPPLDPATLPEASQMTNDQATLAATPRKALAGFVRVPLKAGQRKNVTFTITTQQLSLVVGKDGRREVRPGNLQIQVGGSSVIGPGTLTQTLTLEGAPKAPEYHFVAPLVN